MRPAPRKESRITADAGVLREALRRLPKFTAMIGAAVAALSPFLLPDRLIPQQLAVLRPTTSLLIFVGIVLAWVYGPRVRRRLGRLALTAAGAVLVLLTLQLAFVVRVDEYGHPPVTEYYLVGYRVTGVGREMLNRVGAETLPRSQQIRRVGHDNIPSIFGASQGIVTLAYVLAVVVFVLSATMTVSALEMQVAQTRRRRGEGGAEG